MQIFKFRFVSFRFAQYISRLLRDNVTCEIECYLLSDAKKAVSLVSLHFVPSLHCILYPVCSLQSAFCTDRFASPLISQLSGLQILNYFASTGEELVKVQRVLWFHSWVVIRFQRTMHAWWIAYSKLTIFSHILPKPASCSRQFTPKY